MVLNLLHDPSDRVDVARVFEANSSALCKKSCTLIEKSTALDERSSTSCAGIAGGSGQLTAEGVVFVAQAPSKSVKLTDAAIRFTMRGVALFPGRDERLACDSFLITKLFLQKTGAGGVVLPQLGDVTPVKRRGDLVAAQKAGGGTKSHSADLDPKRDRHPFPP